MTADRRTVEASRQCTLDLRVYEDDVAGPHAGIYTTNSF